ncbi:MAG TPA: AzlD domain-containing protein [Firmicutes bacterium]|jgi:branched-subunit amino acid transport protein|nr:AzlD domain-containing protein [Bacillota bacterium]
MHYASEKIILAIILMAAVTYLPRFLPLFFLSRRKLAPLLEIWLSYVPAAVLASLLGPALLMPEGKLTIQITENIYFWAALPSFVVAICTRNMFITVLVGMGSAALLRLLI